MALRVRYEAVIGLLGLGKFDDVGGWFVFTGRKNRS